MPSLRTPKQNPKLGTTKVVSGTLVKLRVTGLVSLTDGRSFTEGPLYDPFTVNAGESVRLTLESELDLPTDLHYLATRDGLSSAIVFGDLKPQLDSFKAIVEITNVGPFTETISEFKFVAVEAVMFRGIPMEELVVPKLVKPKKKARA